MGNHVHLALERGSVSLSRIVLALHSAYSQRFNRRHGRVGHLFQGRFKSFLVEKENYLLALIRYIHLNPVRAGMVSHARAYRWSSDRYYRAAAGPDWLDLDVVLSMLAPRRSLAVGRYRRLVDETAESEYDEAETPAPSIQGSDDFALRMIRASERSIKWRANWTIELVVEAAARSYGLTVQDLKGRRRRDHCSQARAVAAYLGRSEAGIPVSRTASFLCRDESTLVRLVLNLENAMATDQALGARVRQVGADLRGSNA